MFYTDFYVKSNLFCNLAFNIKFLCNYLIKLLIFILYGCPTSCTFWSKRRYLSSSDGYAPVSKSPFRKNYYETFSCSDLAKILLVLIRLIYFYATFCLNYTWSNDDFPYKGNFNLRRVIYQRYLLLLIFQFWISKNFFYESLYESENLMDDPPLSPLTFIQYWCARNENQ